MESIEQPIFNPYGSDDKDELIDDPTPRGASHLPSDKNSNSNNDTSPIQAAKGLLSSGRESLSNQSRSLMIIIIGTIIFAIIITIALILTIYLIPKQIGGHAAVVTEVDTCSDIALDVMRRGGNAVDAAVAAAFCLGVVHPQSSGIGGGGFLLYHDHKNHKSVAYDFRETAPAMATPDMLMGHADVDMSGRAVGVPGELKGLAEVHQEWGSMDWYALVQPSIDLARYGFNVTKNLADSLANHVDISKIGVMSNFVEVVYNGAFGREGQVMDRPDLVKTLEQVQDGGADVFYRGALGERFVDLVQENSGVIKMSDLEDYTVHRKEPVKSSFKGNTVVGMPAPSSGPTVALMLNMLEGFNWTHANIDLPETYYQMIETFKFGYGHRILLGDPTNPEFKEDIENATAQFVSNEFAAALRAKIDNTSHPASYYGPAVAPTLNKGTTHISVIDSNEVMVSLTLTNNYWFGTKLMTKDGILANNEMMDFSAPTGSLPPNKRNMIVPGMRPLSSMTPTIVYNTEHPCAKRVVLGASNGTRIITGVVETLVNAFLFDLSLRESVARPRIHNQLYPSAVTEYEDVESPAGLIYAISDEIVQALKQKNQTMVKVTEGLSCVQAVMKINDDVQAYSDWRKGGRAATF
ncbi:glutathione hydrolase 1 proenzyme-like [Littorina saxatilis]|uniref:Uncharacterized protein n=1 Tax=Littorina saxatilis TaxID=31220 RepID=A0AAN9G2U2_9CAEN